MALLVLVVLSGLQLWFLSFKVSDPARVAQIQSEAIRKLRDRDQRAMDAATNGFCGFETQLYGTAGSRAFQSLWPPGEDPMSYSDPEFAEARKAFVARLPELEKLLGKANILYPSQWDKGPSATAPNLILVRGIVQNLGRYVHWLMATGQPRQAFRYALLNYEASTKWGRNGGQYACAFSVAFQADAFSDLRDLVMSGKLQPAEYRKVIQAAQASPLSLANLLERMDEEFAFEMQCLDELRQTGTLPPLAQFQTLQSQARLWQSVPGLLERDRRILQQFYLEDRAVMETLRDFPAGYSHRRADAMARWRAWAAELLAPNLEVVYVRYRLGMTRDSALQILAALQLYRLDHQSYPKRLEELVPGYLSALPRDWAVPDGAFLYSQTGKDFTLSTSYKGTYVRPELLSFYPATPKP